MFNPTTGSPTITLFQLRSNYYIVLNPHKLLTLKKKGRKDLIKIDKHLYLVSFSVPEFSDLTTK